MRRGPSLKVVAVLSLLAEVIGAAALYWRPRPRSR
jgi:hypothetical protein